MQLSVQYAYRWGREMMIQLDYAPVGEAALGPVAYPHRASAAELPQAPIGHHWQDSTHTTDDLATVAVRHKWLRVEASGFYRSAANCVDGRSHEPIRRIEFVGAARPALLRIHQEGLVHEHHRPRS
jgi:hypothetical protein